MGTGDARNMEHLPKKATVIKNSHHKHVGYCRKTTGLGLPKPLELRCPFPASQLGANNECLPCLVCILLWSEYSVLFWYFPLWDENVYIIPGLCVRRSLPSFAGMSLFYREFALNLRGETQLGILSNGSNAVSLEMDFMHFVLSNGWEPLTHRARILCIGLKCPYGVIHLMLSFQCRDLYRDEHLCIDYIMKVLTSVRNQSANGYKWTAWLGGGQDFYMAPLEEMHHCHGRSVFEGCVLSQDSFCCGVSTFTL